MLREALAENDLDKIISINYELSEALTKSQFDILGNSASFDSELFNELDMYMREYFIIINEVIKAIKKQLIDDIQNLG